MAHTAANASDEEGDNCENSDDNESDSPAREAVTHALGSPGCAPAEVPSGVAALGGTLAVPSAVFILVFGSVASVAVIRDPGAGVLVRPPWIVLAAVALSAGLVCRA